MRDPPIRIYLLAGCRLLVEAISASLNELEYFVLIGSATELEVAVKQLESEQVDIVLMDGGIDRQWTLEVVMVFKECFPNRKILLTGLGHDEGIVEFIEAGISGYVERGSSFDELLRSISAMKRGEAYCSPDVAASVFSRIVELSKKLLEYPQPQIPKGVELTSREREVLQWVAHGLRNKEIATKLRVTLSTVKNHVHSILRKLQVDSRRNAVRLACEIESLDDPLPWLSVQRR